jgi:hypothetical protein
VLLAPKNDVEDHRHIIIPVFEIGKSNKVEDHCHTIINLYKNNSIYSLGRRKTGGVAENR